MIINAVKKCKIIFKIIGPYPAFIPIKEHNRMNDVFNKALRVKLINNVPKANLVLPNT